MFSWKLCVECVFVYSFNYDAKIIEKKKFKWKQKSYFALVFAFSIQMAQDKLGQSTFS